MGFSTPDFLALGLLFGLWAAIGLLIDNPPATRPSTSKLMAGYRRMWMDTMLRRDPRIFDAQIIGNMRQGAAFFASASMIAIGGGLALVGNADQLRGVASDFDLGNAPLIVWESKLMLLLVFAVTAFLRFVWSHRLFGYCSVLMAAVPNDPDDPQAAPMARKAAAVNITAARGFNSGLRAVYFGIAATTWLVGPMALAAASIFTALIILRREFASQSRRVLLENA